jgi:GntR family transcriptional repressor for pyruvate dehydrogenase complex
MSVEPQAEAELGSSTARRSISEEVANQIRVMIERESLAPGDRLGREEDLARRFGVSRPTLREALRVLSSSYLVRAAKGPGGGIFVAATVEQGIGLSVSESVASMLEAESIGIEELLETRLLFEVPIAGLAAQRATDVDIAQLEALVAQDRLEEDSVLLAEVSVSLHQMVAATARNRLAIAFMSWVVAVLQPLLHDLVAPAAVDAVIVEQSRELVRAIARGDPSAAERAMREHLVYLSDLVSVMVHRKADLDESGAGVVFDH